MRMIDINDILQENQRLKQSLFLKEKEIALLHEKLAYFKRRQFAASSEKYSPDQLSLFDEAENTDTSAEEAESEEQPTTKTTTTPAQRTRKRPSIPDNLPRVDIIHDLTEEEKICPHDGTALKCIGSETHEQLEIIPAKIYVLKHIRHTYACPCCEQHLITASKPKQPIEKSIATPSLLATVATQKYADGLPLYRQVAMFNRIEVPLEPSTLASWMQKCGALVQPLINLIHEKILEEKYLHMDDKNAGSIFGLRKQAA